MKPRSFFAKLREKQLRERIRNDRRNKNGTTGSHSGGSKSGAFQGGSFRLTCSTRNDVDDEDDMWSFDNTFSSMEINLESSTAAAGNSTATQPRVEETPGSLARKENDGRLDAELEDLIQPYSLTPRKRRLEKYINFDQRNQSKRKKTLNVTSVPREVEPTDQVAPPSPLAVDEISNLELSIVEENSPVKPRVKKKFHRNRLINRFVAPSPIKPSSNEASLGQQIEPVESQQPSSNDHFSSQISEFFSSQSISSAFGTPMSEWIHKDVSTGGHLGETSHHLEQVVLFDSPNKQHQMVSCAGASDSPPSLLETFMAIKARYDSSVRLFAYDLRSGKYDDKTALQLYIRKIVDCQDKLVQVFAYDLKDKRNRWVLFRPVDMNEIKEGEGILVYPPWHEIEIPGTDETMIIDTDFYKPSKLALTEKQLEKIQTLPLPTSWDTHVSESPFMDLVPFPIKNQNTIGGHISRFIYKLDIDIVVLHSWTHLSPALFLIKDSDDFLSFLQVPNCSSEEIKLKEGTEEQDKAKKEDIRRKEEEIRKRQELDRKKEEDALKVLQSGKYFKLRRVTFIEKICIGKKLSPFSVLYLFEGKQNFLYTLKWQSTSECIPVQTLDIQVTEMKSSEVNIDEIYMAQPYQDHRICLKCKIKEKDQDGILVTDDESDRSLKIEFVFDVNYKMKKVGELHFQSKTTYLIKFLRVIYGKAIWDCFTTYKEELGEEKDRQD